MTLNEGFGGVPGWSYCFARAVSFRVSPKKARPFQQVPVNIANVNATSNGGYTPLHFTAKAGYKDVAELLLASNAEANAPNDQGKPL